MNRGVALDRILPINSIEGDTVIPLCIKRRGLTRAKFEKIVTAPPKTFHDYPNIYQLLRLICGFIEFTSRLNLIH